MAKRSFGFNNADGKSSQRKGEAERRRKKSQCRVAKWILAFRLSNRALHNVDKLSEKKCISQGGFLGEASIHPREYFHRLN